MQKKGFVTCFGFRVWDSRFTVSGLQFGWQSVVLRSGSGSSRDGVNRVSFRVP